MSAKAGSTPIGLRAPGKRLWSSVADGYELEEHESALLLEACRTVDLCDSLEQIVRSEGAVIDSPQGKKAHPAATEIRQQRIVLARLLAALRVPEEDVQRKPARGPRGVYGIRGTTA